LRVAATPIDIPMHAPFGIAGGAQDVARNVIVTIELADGTLGYGEAAPLPPYNGETQAMALEAVGEASASIVGSDARSWRRAADALREACPRSGAARCAIETALLDALTKRAGLSLWSMFGGAETTLVTDVTLPLGSIEEAASDARLRAKQGFSTLKIKVGAPELALDHARVLAAARAAPSAKILLDGNGGMSARDALALLRSLQRDGIAIALFEQPVHGDDLDGLVEVARDAGVPIAADESARGAADVWRLASLGAAHVINVKIMKAGVAAALDTAIAARAAGLGLMIGGMVEGALAMSMSACLSAGLGGFSFVDLDTPLFLAQNPFDGGYAQDGERLDVSPIRCGHGVTPLATKDAR
jgi:L-alanine-DL-glutamate epimerase-like enolase superfamily enzyme